MQALRLFCAVAECRSFSQAASRHRITQSAASQRIGNLEKQLGVELIDRSVRPLALTAAGQLFFVEAHDLIERYDRLRQRVSKLQPRLTGRVQVCAIYSAGIDLLSSACSQLSLRHPDVEVQIEYQRPDEVYDTVRHHRCDLGIVSYPQHWRDVSHIHLRNEIMAVVCAPGHDLGGRPAVQANELGRWPMAMLDAKLPVARHLRRYLRENGVTPHITNVFDNIDTIKAAVAVTAQISILPKRTVLREIGTSALAAIELIPTLRRPVGIIFRRRSASNGALSPAAKAFVDFLNESGDGAVDAIAVEGRPAAETTP